MRLNRTDSVSEVAPSSSNPSSNIVNKGFIDNGFTGTTESTRAFKGKALVYNSLLLPLPIMTGQPGSKLGRSRSRKYIEV